MSSTPRYPGPMTDSANTQDQFTSPTRPVAVDPAPFRPEPVQPEQPAPVVHLASVTAYRTGIDHVRFWVGAGLAAAIAAMASLVGHLLIAGILQLNIPVAAGTYAVIAAVIVIGASALYNLMLHVAPHPTAYYGALAAVGVALAVLLPFTVPMVLYSQIAFAGLNFVVGLMIAFMVPMAAVAARR